MAQVTGGSDYDFDWEDKMEASTLILQRFSDSVAAQAEEENSPDKIIAPILKLFSFQYSWIGPPRRRPLSEWREMNKSVQQELKSLKKKASESELESVENQLRELIISAIDSWKEGDPEFPKTEIVLNDMVRILFTHKFIKNPPHTKGTKTNT